MRKEWEKLLKKQLEHDGSSLTQVKRKDKQGNIIDLIQPTEDVQNLVETCMNDLSKIINLNIRKTTVCTIG